jgi:glycosyltransferase involved in cell wall biosynthesis
MISVIMCVYNGERFLFEQLDSLRNQTLPPDEVKIYDDCSTDSTREIITDYISKNELSSWRLITNTYNKGWRFNFYDALNECDGDIIFFCDQDDIWYSDKIAVMTEAMQKNPEILVLSGLQHIIDADGKRIENTHITHCGDEYDYGINKSNLYDNLIGKFQHRIGAAMAVKKTLKEQLPLFKRDERLFAHDLWALNMGALLNGCYWINFPAIKYRVHDANASVRLIVSKKNEKETRLEALRGKCNYIQYILEVAYLTNPVILNKEAYRNLERASRLFEKRYKFTKRFDITAFISLFCFMDLYIKYLGIKQCFIDVLESLNLRDKYRIAKEKVRAYRLCL